LQKNCQQFKNIGFWSFDKYFYSNLYCTTHEKFLKNSEQSQLSCRNQHAQHFCVHPITDYAYMQTLIKLHLAFWKQQSIRCKEFHDNEENRILFINLPTHSNIFAKRFFCRVMGNIVKKWKIEKKYISELKFIDLNNCIWWIVSHLVETRSRLSVI
jgi:hypothetical protein